MIRMSFAILLPYMLICCLSCEKSEKGDTDTAETLENNLRSAVAEVMSSSVNLTGLQDIQGTCVEDIHGFENSVRINYSLVHDLEHCKFMIPHLSECAIISVSDSVYPKEIIIDYGTGCADHHHHTMSGIIVVNISDSLNHQGAFRTITSRDLCIDSTKVEINATLTNMGINSDGNWILLSNLNQKIKMNDTVTISQTVQDTVKWISGFETYNKTDDIYYKSGYGKITINDSITYSRKITAPLLYDRSCEYILDGIVELYKGGSHVIIDYGDGTCDNVATVTTDGTTEEINLHSYGFNKHGRFGEHIHGFCQKGS